MGIFVRLFIGLGVTCVYPFALAWGLLDGYVQGRFVHEFRSVPEETGKLFSDMWSWIWRK